MFFFRCESKVSAAFRALAALWEAAEKSRAAAWGPSEVGDPKVKPEILHERH